MGILLAKAGANAPVKAHSPADRICYP